MKIYTKTGDKGTTSLVGGTRVSKGCARLESYGTIDELNAHIGLLLTYCTTKADRDFLLRIQADMFTIGGYLATENPQQKTIHHTQLLRQFADMVSAIEAEIDRIDSLLPPLHQFILPGGTRAACQAHVCRTVCRKAERCVVRLIEDGTPIDSHLTSYLNRMSDYFFLLARKLNLDVHTAESPITHS